MRAASLLSEVIGSNIPVAVTTWDGGRIGPPDAPATITVRSPAALARLFKAPGQLGLGRAYVSGDLDVEGDIFAVLDLPRHLAKVELKPRQWLAALWLASPAFLRRLPVPKEEARLRRPATAANATGQPSRTTTTCPASSTSCCWGPR